MDSSDDLKFHDGIIVGDENYFYADEDGIKMNGVDTLDDDFRLTTEGDLFLAGDFTGSYAKILYFKAGVTLNSLGASNTSDIAVYSPIFTYNSDEEVHYAGDTIVDGDVSSNDFSSKIYFGTGSSSSSDCGDYSGTTDGGFICAEISNTETEIDILNDGNLNEDVLWDLYVFAQYSSYDKNDIAPYAVNIGFTFNDFNNNTKIDGEKCTLYEGDSSDYTICSSNFTTITTQGDNTESTQTYPRNFQLMTTITGVPKSDFSFRVHYPDIDADHVERSVGGFILAFPSLDY